MQRANGQRDPRRFDGKVAVVTAGAAGIGKASARLMAQEGATVVLVDKDAGSLAASVAELAAESDRVLGLPCDALDENSVDQAVAEIQARFGRIDILVNGVGGSTVIANPNRLTENLSFAEWRQLIDFNLSATFLFCHAVVPIMKSQRRGKIVNISSVAGRGVGTNSSAAYAAGKGGIIAFTKKLALETAPFGVTVNAIAPGMTISERMKDWWEQRSDAERQQFFRLIPLGRVFTVEEQARVVCFLAAADSDIVTGQTIDTSGGQV
ncbi:MAG: SDR family NAD(P)-dependent oxidoreductase [Reyranellaceae bacterium]